MTRLTNAITRAHTRSARHFTVLRDTITRDNLLSLRRATVCYEMFLAVYGLWAVSSFNSRMLGRFYLLFFALNTCLTILVFLYSRQAHPSYRIVQAGCMELVLLVMAFVVCISVFPFPDRPSLFYPLAYTMMVIPFQFPYAVLSLVLTGVTGVFILLSYLYKTPAMFTYDLATAMTTWLLGFIFTYLICDLHLRNGEILTELDRLSQTDPLTGLPNRRGLDSFLVLSYRRCARLQMAFTAIILDMDRFKQLNDHFGHAAGDHCLKELGARLSIFAEETGFFAARYGGDEFVLLLPGCGAEEAEAHAQTLMETLPFTGPDGELVNISIGVAVDFPREGTRFSDLLERADSALYHSKANARGRFTIDCAPSA